MRGVIIPHPRHSVTDADGGVVLHALTPQEVRAGWEEETWERGEGGEGGAERGLPSLCHQTNGVLTARSQEHAWQAVNPPHSPPLPLNCTPEW